MPRAVFFDVDGTLIDSSVARVPRSTLLAIQRLREKGYKVAIASGREKTGLAEIERLEIGMFDGFVLSNGAAVFDREFRCISLRAFSDEEIRHVLKFSQENDIGLVFETTEDRFAVTDMTVYMERSQEYYHESPAPRREWNGEKIVKINAFQEYGIDFSGLEEKVPMCIVPCPGWCYDIMPQGVTKSSGIDILMQSWGMETDDYICFGDHENDREMIEKAKIGVVVKDRFGSEELRKTAKYTCESAANDGIYHFLTQMALIEK